MGTKYVELGTCKKKSKMGLLLATLGNVLQERKN